jgi:hypothetical protein
VIERASEVGELARESRLSHRKVKGQSADEMLVGKFGGTVTGVLAHMSNTDAKRRVVDTN